MLESNVSAAAVVRWAITTALGLWPKSISKSARCVSVLAVSRVVHAEYFLVLLERGLESCCRRVELIEMVKRLTNVLLGARLFLAVPQLRELLCSPHGSPSTPPHIVPT